MGLIRKSLYLASGGVVAPHSKKQRTALKTLAAIQGASPEEVRRTGGRYDFDSVVTGTPRVEQGEGEDHRPPTLESLLSRAERKAYLKTGVLPARLAGSEAAGSEAAAQAGADAVTDIARALTFCQGREFVIRPVYGNGPGGNDSYPGPGASSYPLAWEASSDREGVIAVRDNLDDLLGYLDAR